MAIDTTAPRTRRAVLAASLGGLAATVLAALGRPDIARAGSDGDVILGVQTNSTTGVTGITNTVSNAVFYAADSLGVGVEGGGSDKGVYGTSLGGYGVYGHASTGTAVYGESTTGPGVVGTGGTGVSGTSPSGYGVLGSSGGNAAVGGYSNAAGAPAARFWSPANTGVFGEAVQDNTARGVYGRTTVGQGVRGQATSGVGGFFTAGTSGTALKAAGRVSLNRSGLASVPANASSVDVTVPGGLAGTPLPFATLQVLRSGVVVAAVRPNFPTAGVMRIYLNKVASTTAATPLSWVVLG